MVLHNPNNWHWVNKDASPWAKEFLESQMISISSEEEDVSAKVTKLISMDGDVEVSQRKGKVISIFDVSLSMEYEGRRRPHAERQYSEQEQARTRRAQMSVEASECQNVLMTRRKKSTLYVLPSSAIEGQARTC